MPGLKNCRGMPEKKGEGDGIDDCIVFLIVDKERTNRSKHSLSCKAALSSQNEPNKHIHE